MRFLRAVRRRVWFSNALFPGFRVPKGGEDELKRELDADLHEEPQEPLPDAEISEKERREALRQYKREMQERGQP